MAISCGFKEVMAFIASVSMRPTLMKQQQYKTCTRRLIQRNKTYIKLLLLEIGREQSAFVTGFRLQWWLVNLETEDYNIIKDEGIRFRYLLPIIGNRQDFNPICVLAANGFANSSWSSLKSVKCIELGPEFSLNSPNDVNKGTVADLLNVSCGLVVKVWDRRIRCPV